MEATDDSSPLCCCEYYNLNGQRSHIIALCCECEDLDNAVDQCLKGQGLSGEKCGIICEVISDRIRIPWIRGAVKFDIETIVPIIVLSGSSYFASSGFIFTVLSFVYLPIFVLVYYAYSLKKKRNTWFFVSWACTSLFGIYGLFVKYIAEKCSPINNIALCFMFVLVLVLYYRVVTSKEKILFFTQSKSHKNGIVPQVKKMKKKSFGEADIDYGQLPCCFCTYGPFTRSKHCRICGYCVPRSDHHCVWTNCCIGHHNQLPFLVTIITFVISASWGVYLSLQTICNPIPDSLYVDCSKVYKDSENAIMFVSSFYTIIFIVSMSALLVQQMFFISFNITGDEWRRGSRNKTFWQIVWTNPHNRGFLLNWMEFLFPRIATKSSYELV